MHVLLCELNRWNSKLEAASKCIAEAVTRSSSWLV